MRIEGASLRNIFVYQQIVDRTATRGELNAHQKTSAIHIPDAATRTVVNRAVAGQARIQVTHGNQSGYVGAIPTDNHATGTRHSAIPGLGMTVDIKI